MQFKAVPRRRVIKMGQYGNDPMPKLALQSVQWKYKSECSAENLGKPWCLGGGSHLFNLAAHWAHCHQSAFCVVVFFPHDVLWRRMETPHTIKLKELHMQSDFLKVTRVTRFVE